MSTVLSLTNDNVVDYLSQHFNIIGVFNLNEYDWCLDKLYNQLATIKKSEFAHNDRIIFKSLDTLYYVNNSISLLIHNIQQILYQLDIPNYFCLFVTNQDYLAEEFKIVKQAYGTEKCSIGLIDIYLDWGQIDLVNDVEFNFNLIERSYITLSRNRRKHRVMLFSLLNENSLLDKGLVSFGINGVSKDQSILQNSDSIHKDLGINTLSVQPWTRINDTWPILDYNLHNTYDSFLKSIPPTFSFKNFTEAPIENYCLFHDVIQRGFLYVCTEAAYHYPGTAHCEKIFKGFSNKRPMVSVGPPGTLKKLKDWGFKTFDCWWDEGYDNIKDPSKRMLAVFNIIQNISKKSINELVELGNEMRDVLQYNCDYLNKEFTHFRLKSLHHQCIENLKPRYD